MDRVLADDKKVVQFQLGRDISNPFTVKKRCKWGYPVCIESRIIHNGKPFPTLYWLTCPFLSKRVGRLEEKGNIGLFEMRLKTDKTLRDMYGEAHKKTVEIKKEMLKHYENLQDWQIESIVSRGIGGIRNRETVKCLHLQLANYLGGVENPIGKMVYEVIVEHECPENEIICSGVK